MKKLKIFFPWLYVLFWMGLILYYSAQPGDVSSDVSLGLLNFILSPIEEWFPSFYDAISIYPLESYLRNLAHIGAFFILGLFIFNASFKSNFKKPYFKSFVIGMSYALWDEFFQSFIPGRASEFKDVLLDSLGIILALSLIYFLSFMKRLLKDFFSNKDNLTQEA